MQRVSNVTAYLLWGLSIFGICGIQRLYTGRIISGLLYLFTFGIFGIGQIIDLLLIPGMVSSRNRELALLEGGRMPAVMSMASTTPPVKTISPMQKLLQAARENGGSLSPAQAALFTELEADQVKKLLNEAERAGYAEISNDPKTGAIRYVFDL